MSVRDQKIISTKELEWTDKKRAPGVKKIGQQVKFTPFGGQLQGYLASDFCQKLNVSKKETFRVRLADGPPGRMFIQLGAPVGAKLSRQGKHCFSFAATGLVEGTQVSRYEKTTWVLDRIEKGEVNQSIVRLREITW